MTGNNIRGRLAALESAAGGRECSACSRWSLLVELVDARVADEPRAPMMCPKCGRELPVQRVTVVETIVERPARAGEPGPGR